MTLIPVPADFGKGGANIGDGDPRLADILTKLTAAVTELQNAPPAFFLLRTIAGRNGAGPLTFTGARVGDTVASITGLSHDGANPPNWKLNDDAGGHYVETDITVDDQIQQTSGNDLSGVGFLISLSRT